MLSDVAIRGGNMARTRIMTDTPQRGAISSILNSRQELAKFSIVAVLAALAVGVIGGIIVDVGAEHRLELVIGSVAVVILSLGYLFRQVWKSLQFSDEIEAALFFDESGELLSVKDYRFSREVKSIIKAVEAESKAIHADWSKNPLVEAREPTKSPEREDQFWIAITKEAAKQPSAERKPAIEFIEEVTAFVMLEELSLHLSSHFTYNQPGNR